MLPHFIRSYIAFSRSLSFVQILFNSNSPSIPMMLYLSFYCRTNLFDWLCICFHYAVFQDILCCQLMYSFTCLPALLVLLWRISPPDLAAMIITFLINSHSSGMKSKYRIYSHNRFTPIPHSNQRPQPWTPAVPLMAVLCLSHFTWSLVSTLILNVVQYL